MIRRPPRSTLSSSSAASDVYKRQEQKRFILHHDAVCSKSKFFRAACSERWLEGQERIVRLPEAKPVAFQEYCRWIYYGQVADGTCTMTSSNIEKLGETQRLIDLYLLGDQLDDTQLRNQANIKLFKSLQNANTMPSIAQMELVWDSTTRGSSLRKLLVDVVVLLNLSLIHI